MKLNKALIALIFPLFAFSYGPQRTPMEYYYNLNFLKSAGAPQVYDMIKLSGESGIQKITKGLLFTYKNRAAKSVRISGNFSNWRGVPMTKNSYGIWYYYLDEFSGFDRIKYKFMVDGTWIMDPENDYREDDGTGSFISAADAVKQAEGKNVSWKALSGNYIEFRLYSPKAKYISLVGDFNHWNPENDVLKKGSDGIWRLKKHIPSGKHRYKFVIDGAWSLDIYNPLSASDDTGEVCSLIEIK